jgi:hypothetical protein
MYANGSPIVQNLAFGQLTEYACVMPGMYRLTVYPAGTTAAPLIDVTITISVRMNATLALFGLLANIGLMVIEEPPVFLTYTSALIRAVQLSPDVPAVDVAGNGTVLLQNVSYQMVTNYVPLNPGIYTFDLRATGTGQVLATTPNVTIGPGKANTAFVIGLAAGTPPLQLLVAVDANSYKR